MGRFLTVQADTALDSVQIPYCDYADERHCGMCLLWKNGSTLQGEQRKQACAQLPIGKGANWGLYNTEKSGLALVLPPGKSWSSGVQARWKIALQEWKQSKQTPQAHSWRLKTWSKMRAARPSQLC